MTKDHVLIVIDELTAWVDATLAVGIASMGERHRAVGEALVQKLVVVGLGECGKALAEVLHAELNESIPSFGRLVVVLELTRESFEIERITGGTNINGKEL